ncbi:MAG: respiratory nitrate reductase subunit beta [Gammaproteobacteria bacterium]|nr:respiratory nitrate reductase subunit beta [Gammaproteobacteria bacterium]
MVMDLNKCIGCQTCSVACKTLWTRQEGMEGMWWNTVNTTPGQGTPRGYEGMGGGFRDGKPLPGHLPTQEEFGVAWQFNHEQVFYGGDPQAWLRPTGGDPQWGPNWDEDVGAGEYPNSYYFYVPRICNHCTRPACLEACPRAAIEKRREDGIVVINEDRCRGYQFCAEACPYKKIYYNTVRGISQKCVFCFPRLEQGVATACSRQCPGRVRFLGFLDDPEGPIHKLVYEWKVALPLHPEYETEPNVFYVPPFSAEAFDAEGRPSGEPRVPPQYLESLFGVGVNAALATLVRERERARSGHRSELMDLLIARRWLDMFSVFDKSPRDVERRLEDRANAAMSGGRPSGAPAEVRISVADSGARKRGGR